MVTVNPFKRKRNDTDGAAVPNRVPQPDLSGAGASIAGPGPRANPLDPTGGGQRASNPALDAMNGDHGDGPIGAPAGQSNPNNAANMENDPAMQPADQPSDIDQLEEDFVRNSFAGPRDTSQEEAAARADQQDKMNEAIYNQRASMGAGGFGLGGAQSAVELTQRRKASQDLTNEILGIQQGARDEAFNHGVAGFGLDIAGKGEANKEAILKAQADALKAILGGGGEGGEGGSGGSGGDGGSGGGGGGGPVDLLDEQSSGQPAAQDPRDPNLPKRNAPGAGDQIVYSDGVAGSPGHYVVYRGSDGTLYRVG